MPVNVKVQRPCKVSSKQVIFHQFSFYFLDYIQRLLLGCSLDCKRKVGLFSNLSKKPFKYCLPISLLYDINQTSMLWRQFKISWSWLVIFTLHYIYFDIFSIFSTTLISLISVDVGINVEGGIFWKKLVHNSNKRGVEGGKI